MSIKRRKIGFYILEFQEFGDQDSIINVNDFPNILRFILNQDLSERIFDLTNKNKFHLLSVADINGDYIKGFFKSAKYNHSPDLINKVDASERTNPKDLQEGESELTHFVMKSRRNNIFLILEERKVGIPISQLVNYLDLFTGKYYQSQSLQKNFNITYTIVPKSNFYEELINLNRAYIVKIYTDKRMLGDDYLELTDRVESVQQDIEIEIKANRRANIKQVVLDWINNESIITNPEIRKIKVIGKNEEGNQIILDTEFMKKIESIEVDLNDETGIVNSENILSNLMNLLPRNE